MVFVEFVFHTFDGSVNIFFSVVGEQVVAPLAKFLEK